MSLLRIDPAQMPRLEEIRANLLDRLQEANDQGWLGGRGPHSRHTSSPPPPHSMQCATSPPDPRARAFTSACRTSVLRPGGRVQARDVPGPARKVTGEPGR